MQAYIVNGFKAERIVGYNCSNRTTEEWQSKTVVDFRIGICYLFYGCVTEVIYAVVMRSIWRMKRSNTCFHIMFLLGLFDMISLVVNSILSGILWILGGNYCTAPDLNYVAGAFAVASWGGACFCCLLLALNRLTDLWEPYYNEKLFGPRLIYPWLLCPFLYYLYFFFFTRPVLFNSALGSWFFSPFIEETTAEMIEFANFSHTVNNLGVVAVTTLFYVLLLLAVGHKFGSRGLSTITSMRRQMMIQTFLICSASFIGSIIYVYMQFFIIPNWIILTAHFCWQASNGIPAYVYLIFNNKIRKDVLKSIGQASPPSDVQNSAGISALFHGPI